MANTDKALAAEAMFVAEKTEAHGHRMLDEDADPAQAAELVQRCMTVFKGSNLGTEASKLACERRLKRAARGG